MSSKAFMINKKSISLFKVRLLMGVNHPPGRPISRILSGGGSTGAIISLGCASRRTSTRSTRNSNGTSSPLFLLDLAPDGGCLAADIAARAGGLLHHLFTLTPPT